MTESKTKLIILECGTTLSKFTKKFIGARNLKAKIIPNTLLDFFIEGDKENKPESWIQLELIHLASTIVPDDLTASPLASLFTKSKQIRLIPLSPSEQFLGSWFSEIVINDKNPTEATRQLFKTLANYHTIPTDVIPLTFRDKQITIKYRNQEGPLRFYSMFGALDMNKFIPIDPKDMQSALSKEDFKFNNLDLKDSIVSASLEKNFKEADAVIISAGDLTSLTVLLSFEDIRKVIKKSSGTVVAIAPIGSKISLTNERETVLLEALGISPDLDGFALLLKNVADTLIIDQNDSSQSQILRESGFNVVVEDLVNFQTNQDFIETVLRSANIDTDDIKIETLDVPQKKNSDSLKKLALDVSKGLGVPVELNDTHSEENIIKTDQTKEKLQKTIIEAKLPSKNASEDEKPITSVDESEDDNRLQKNQEKQIVSQIQENKLQQEKSSNEVTNGKSNDEVETPVPKNQQQIEVAQTKTMEEKTPLKNEKEEIKEKISDKKENGELKDKIDAAEHSKKEDDTPEVSDRDFIDKILDEIEAGPIPENLDKQIAKIDDKITKNSTLEVHVGNRLLELIIDSRAETPGRKLCLRSYAKLAKNHALSLRRVIISWLKGELDNPDFAIQDFQVSLLLELAELEVEFVGEAIATFTVQSHQPEISALARERSKDFILKMAFHNPYIARVIIRTYLDLFEDEKVNQGDIWAALTSFDARLVAIELIEGFSVAKSREISETAIIKGVGSFGIVLNDIVTAWVEGNMDRLLNLCGSLSEKSLRKAKRLAIAQQLKKLGSVPVETFSKTVELEPKELEGLVFEMITNDEISAKLEVIEGRLYIIKVEKEEEQNL